MDDLITVLKNGEALSATRIAHRNREDCLTSKKQYREADYRIQRLLERYDPSNKIQYLSGINLSIYLGCFPQRGVAVTKEENFWGSKLLEANLPLTPPLW